MRVGGRSNGPMSVPRIHETSPLPTEPQTLSERLRWLRKQKCLTQVELAEALGCEQAMVSSWEVGRTRPSSVTLGALARYYGLSALTLDSGEGFLAEAARSLHASQESVRQTEGKDGLTLTLESGSGGLVFVDAATGTQISTDAAQAMAELLKALKKGRRAWVVVK